MAAPDRANDRGRIIFDDIRGAKTGLFGDPVKEVHRWNPVVQSQKQIDYANARQTATPARGQEVTIKGVNDNWANKRAIAQGVENTGGSQRYNPATANSPTQTAYREARWAPGADKPLRGAEVNIKGVSDRGWGTRTVGRGAAFTGGMLGTFGGGGSGGPFGKMD
jgi:hypothetical protein